MRLAEALAERAAASRRVEQLRARIVASARHQEGETPAEDAQRLLTAASSTLDDLEDLIRRVNRTNAATPLVGDGSGDGGDDDGGGDTLTDALARRDVMRLRHAVITAAADAAAGKEQRGYAVRQLRSELRMLAALPVAALRQEADLLARQIRELDVRIQRTNWAVELLE